MKKQLFLTLLFSLPSFAQVLHPVPATYDYSSQNEYQVIAKLIDPKATLEVSVDKKGESQVIEEKPKLSQGQRLVEEAKARNRALIAEQNKTIATKAESSSSKSQIEQWREETKQVQEGWKKEILEQRKMWQQEQEIFLGRLKIYKENTFKLPVKVEKIVEKKIPRVTQGHVINAAFDVPIRDQKNRPTCSAFAGVRALEIILAQNKKMKDLSEQYLYWASKPNCQNSPCEEKGSWVVNGYRYSQQKKIVDIPLEASCAYKEDNLDENETQTPLTPACQVGSVKVAGFEGVRTLMDVIETLKKDTPVIISTKLTSNFYVNDGFITYADSQKDSSIAMDDHAKGHAYLAIGYLELPEKYKNTEGSFCLLVANSWGKGWGAGGYGCLTEKWLTTYRTPSTFIAVTGVRE